MIDKIASKIKQYPFQTGIAAGFILCLLLSLIMGLFQDHGNTLAGNIDLIQEDYLRMAISEYSENNDSRLAAWRYKFLGSRADKILARMSADSTIPAQDLVAFADAIQKRDAVDMGQGKEIPEGSPANPKRGISTFAKIILILMGIGILAAAGLYLYSKYGKKSKQKNWSGKLNDLFTHRKPVQMVFPEESWQEEISEDTPEESDSLFDLDKMFSGSDSGFMNKKSVYEPIQETPAGASRPVRSHANPEKEDILHDTQDLKPIAPSDEEEEDFAEETGTGFDSSAAAQSSLNTSGTVSSSISPAAAAPAPEYNETDYPAEEKDEENRTEDEAENPLPSPAETEDDEYETEADAAPNVEESIPSEEAAPVPPRVESHGYTLKNQGDSFSAGTSDSINKTDGKEPVQPELNETVRSSAADENNNGLLLHFQSRYTIGNDMYDEVFSIEQGLRDENVFRGECGIGIGETLNNTEPKAVTAFEIWLFDRDDIHTATQYLLSDFAVTNDGISSRLKAHGLCNTIQKNVVYTLETQSLTMDLKVLELEYGNETEEQRAYFRDVLFDVCVREKA